MGWEGEVTSYKIGWPTVVVASVGATALTLVLLFAPEDVRGEIAGPLGVLAIAAAGLMDRIIQAKDNK